MSGLPNRDRLAERRATTRREILDAAGEIARVEGLAAVTLRDIAKHVGMQSPSLYSHFESKNAIFDAMFADAWANLYQLLAGLRLPDPPRAGLLTFTTVFFEFSTADVARYQLMNQVAIPTFTPSDDAFAHAVLTYDLMRNWMAANGVHDQADLDLWTAMTSGLISQHMANDRGGTRWRHQLPRIVDVFCDEVEIPGPPLRRRS